MRGLSKGLIGSIRRECLDHLIVLDERYLRELANRVCLLTSCGAAAKPSMHLSYGDGPKRSAHGAVEKRTIEFIRRDRTKLAFHGFDGLYSFEQR